MKLNRIEKTINSKEENHLLTFDEQTQTKNTTGKKTRETEIQMGGSSNSGT